MTSYLQLNRRDFLGIVGKGVLCASVPGTIWAEQAVGLITKAIPSSDEQLPVIGMGTWITFNVGRDPDARDNCTRILETFFELGGRLVDSSPMYGSAEEVLGHVLNKLGRPQPGLFSATKVWTGSTKEGRRQIENSFGLWGLEKFDLFQIHNLLNWEEHLKTLRALKEKGRIRYIGITTSHGRRHGDLEKILKSEKLDFVQLTYNMLDREAEKRLLPLAKDMGVAVIANRPFQGGGLFDKFKNRPLPPWAGEVRCSNWPEFFLKWIVSHPAVTCAIPATSQAEHMRENMGSLRSGLPDSEGRRRMSDFLARL